MSDRSVAPAVRLGPGRLNALTDVPGLAVGHFTHDQVLRGVTAILCEGGATAGVSVRGANPGTINTDALAATTAGGIVHGIGLSGGSMFGLGAVSGIVELLFHRGIGHRYRGALVPVVAGAVIFDLAFSDPTAHPTAEWGTRPPRLPRGGNSDAATSGPARAELLGRGRAASG